MGSYNRLPNPSLHLCFQCSEGSQRDGPGEEDRQGAMEGRGSVPFAHHGLRHSSEVACPSEQSAFCARTGTRVVARGWAGGQEEGDAGSPSLGIFPESTNICFELTIH